MFRTDDIMSIISGGGNVVAQDGTKIGSIGQVYLDDETSQPEWVTAKTGLFGRSESFVPLNEATVEGQDIRVPFDKDKVKDAPRVEETEEQLSPSQEADLYRYYGLTYNESYAGERHSVGVAGRDTEGHDTSGPSTDEAMTRSEEQIRVGTQDVETGRVRLRKYVETENVTQTIPVRREKAVIEREPITDDNVGQAMSGPAISEEEHEIVLSEERPVVQKETVPVERVHLGKERVTEQQTVSEEVRKERIVTDGDVEDRR